MRRTRRKEENRKNFYTHEATHRRTHAIKHTKRTFISIFMMCQRLELFHVCISSFCIVFPAIQTHEMFWILPVILPELRRPIQRRKTKVGPVTFGLNLSQSRIKQGQRKHTPSLVQPHYKTTEENVKNEY